MHLYLMRHAEAVERDEWDGPDKTRPLTKAGRHEAARVAQALISKYRAKVDAVWTSPLVRAMQTAEIAAEALKAPVAECPELAGGAQLSELAAALKRAKAPDRLMLVGHEPDFGWLLAGLLGGAEPLPFKKAGVACLTGAFKQAGMKLLWRREPKDLPKA
jgi:phosphohistidine phosphatase